MNEQSHYKKDKTITRQSINVKCHIFNVIDDTDEVEERYLNIGGDCIEDMVPNIWVPVKVAYDKHALWGISYWREQRKTFYGYARGLELRHDVYFTKCILAVTQVKVMRKHGYGYLKEIIVRRADNDLYRFK
ncbi:hypothetical protein Tco_0026910 [Tanacetum coccineum]